MQTDLPPPVSTQYVQTDEAIVGAASLLYALVAMHSDPVRVYDRGSDGSPTLPSGSLGPPFVGSRAVVMHEVSCHRTVAEIL